ncbi:hypothetical protein B0H16DRAFT_1308267, partial [Mycena metata]
MFANHDCAHCPEVFTIFKCVQVVPDGSAQVQSRNKRTYVSRERAENEAVDLKKYVQELKTKRKRGQGLLEDLAFPPRPFTFRGLHRILARYCRGMKPDQFLEGGCAVCGCLELQSRLGPLDSLRSYLSVLVRPGVTRRERLTSQDMIEELEGPILAADCDRVCMDCEVALVNKKVPKNALALHNWIGPVPMQLRDLKYAEQMMIARVRHNRCVIRVHSGRVRMNANAIMFSSPVLKIYN